jgi:uncharacterized membrane protein YfcA
MLELAIVTVASLVAGFVNAIAGGGGLISIPVLFGVFPTAPPATLFGTSKAAMVWGTAWAAADYSRHVRLPWRTLLPACVAAIVGGLSGAWLVTLVSAGWLRSLLPVMLSLALVYTLLSGNLGQTHAPKYGATTEAILASVISLLLGFYDGFFGPGTGSFFIFLFVRVLGFDFLHAVASAKVLNTTTNLAALALFGWAGHVWWQFMIPMAVANVLGSHLGASLAVRRGSGFIRMVFVGVVAALILKSVTTG